MCLSSAACDSCGVFGVYRGVYIAEQVAGRLDSKKWPVAVMKEAMDLLEV